MARVGIVERERVVAVEPQKAHRLPGLKSFQEAKEPSILDWEVIDRVVRIDDEPAYEMTRRLFREEALIVGPSTGAVVAAANELRDELREERDGVVVGVSPDSGLKYMSYFSELLGDEGTPDV